MKRFVLMMVAACGTDPDIPQPDGPFIPGVVTIEVTNRGQPAANVPVIFQNADSSVARSTVTDGAGRAEAEIGGDSFVTVIEPRELSVGHETLSTYAGVQGGDELHHDLAPLGDTESKTFGLRIEADSDPLAVGGHMIFTECGPLQADLTMVSPVVLTGCGAEADVLVVSIDEFGNNFRSQFHPGLSLDIDHDFTMPPDQMPYTAFVDAMVQFRSIPAEVTFIGVNRALADDNLRPIFELNVGVMPDVSKEAALKVPVMTGSTDVVASSLFPAPGEVGIQLITEWGPTSTDPYDLDVTSAMLPRYTERPTFDPARRTATWTEAAQGDNKPDAVRIRLQVHRIAIPESTTWEWRMIYARSGTSVTFPSLPIDDVTGFNFNPGMFDAAAVADLTTIKVDGGYDAIRARGFETIRNLRAGPSGLIVTQDLHEEEPIGEPEL